MMYGIGYLPWLFGAPIGAVAGAYPRFIGKGFGKFPPWGVI